MRLSGAFLTVFLAAMTLVSASTPATAQWTGTRLGTNATKKDPEAVMRVTAECIAARGPTYAQEMLELLPGSEAEFRLIRRNEGDVSICMDSSQRLAVGSVEMSFTARGLRPILAEEMLKRELLNPVEPESLSVGEAWFLPQLATARLENLTADYAYLSYLEFGDCVVANAPAKAIAFLQADAKSVKEQAAIVELMPVFSSCVAAGDEVELTKESLRLALSEPAFHRIKRAKLGN